MMNSELASVPARCVLLKKYSCAIWKTGSRRQKQKQSWLETTPKWKWFGTIQMVDLNVVVVCVLWGMANRTQ